MTTAAMPTIPTYSAEVRSYPGSKLLRIVDGDTIDVLLDMGFGMYFAQPVRLAGINAPEDQAATKAAGDAATAHLASLIPVGTALTVETLKAKDKYGRRLAWVYLPTNMLLTINQQMLDAGHAVPYNGGKRT